MFLKTTFLKRQKSTSCNFFECSLVLVSIVTLYMKWMTIFRGAEYDDADDDER